MSGTGTYTRPVNSGQQSSLKGQIEKSNLNLLCEFVLVCVCVFVAVLVIGKGKDPNRL